jgi:hypothetical protein
MPRRKKIAPTLHSQKHERFIKVKYEQTGKRKVFEMDIPALEGSEITINSPLEPLIAKRLGCDSADIFLVNKNEFEPYMVINPRADNEVQE